MSSRSVAAFVAVALFICAACTATGPPARAFFPFANLRAQLFSPPQVLADARRESFGDELNAIVICIDESSSFRAVSDAVLRLRERKLAVGYWVDARCAPGARDDFDSRLAHARAVLENRPPADAIFLAGLQGKLLACGCTRASCAAAAAGKELDPLECARFVAALRGFTGSSIVVPVWLDAASQGMGCVDPSCIEAHCAERDARAWIALRAESERLAVQFSAPIAEESTSQVALRLARWSRLEPSGPLAHPGPVATIIAVFPALDWPGAQLARAVADAKALRHAGFLVSYCPLPSN